MHPAGPVASNNATGLGVLSGRYNRSVLGFWIIRRQRTGRWAGSIRGRWKHVGQRRFARVRSGERDRVWVRWGRGHVLWVGSNRLLGRFLNYLSA